MKKDKEKLYIQEQSNSPARKHFPLSLKRKIMRIYTQSWGLRTFKTAMLQQVAIDRRPATKCVPDCRHTISEMRMSEADMTRHLSQHATGYFKNLQLYPPMATDELQTEEVDELLEILDSTLGEAGDKDSRSIGMQLTLDTYVEIGIQGVRLHRASSRHGRTRTTKTLQMRTSSILSSVTRTKPFISLPNSSWLRT